MWHEKIGKNLTVKIPKDYADYVGIKEGDKVYFQTFGKKSLLLGKAGE